MLDAVQNFNIPSLAASTWKAVCSGTFHSDPREGETNQIITVALSTLLQRTE